eukprot:TRINITY_DN6153_c0_g1_i1.p1 TRINITY_DN6153_c0_g1~~TRINITY_DN6153_c0_g1_i1.p1  ORF type:complete len:1157 (-),score=241.56 TRINITY_DN6153_c0_g1_i1:17-3487(-)
MANNILQKAPERFAQLLRLGEGLLHRLYFSRHVFLKARPLFLNDQQYLRVLKVLTSKFPDYPETDKIQGYDLLTSRGKALCDELEIHYEVLVDCFDWKEASLQLLNEIGNQTSVLQNDVNIRLMSSWLDLMLLYVKVHLLAAAIPEKRVILSVYYKMYHFVRSAWEPNYLKVSKWLILYENPIRQIQEDFRAINDPMGKALMSTMMSYMKSRTITALRKDGALNLTLKPEELGRPAQDPGRLDLVLTSRVQQWVLYGFLLVPGALGLPGSVDYVKFVLSEGYLLPVFRDVTFAPYPEYVNLFDNYKSKAFNLQKQKKVVKEAATSSVAESGRKHTERRIYIRQELEALVNILTDKPALLGPKINIVWAGLQLAKEEILWYFRHQSEQPPEKLRKSYKPEEFKEKRISSLLFLVDKLVELVNHNRQIIQLYYFEYLLGADYQAVQSFFDTSFMNSAGPNIAPLAQTILQEISNAQSAFEQLQQGRSPDVNFRNLRNTWARMESLMSQVNGPVNIAMHKKLAQRLELVALHSRQVDAIDEQIDEYASLKLLYYFRDPVFQAFETSIADGPDQPLHAVSFLKLMSSFPGNATEFWPEEREAIGIECVGLANSCMTKIASRIATILHTVATQYITNDYQISDANAAFPLLQKSKDWKPPKDFQPPLEPGSESYYKNRPNLETIRLYERNAWQLCTALQSIVEIQIYDHVFVPREFLRERIANNLRTFLRKAISVNVQEGLIQRPSVLEMQIRVYISVIIMVENFVDIDVGDLIREVVLGESYVKPLGKIGRVDWFPDGEVDYQDSMIRTVVSFYSDLLTKKIIGNPAVVYSPVRQGFISKTQTPFHVEEYCDLVELQSLCRLIGPYGFKLLENQILKYVVMLVNGLKEVIISNAPVLDVIQSAYHREARCLEEFRRLKDVDIFMNRALAVGSALNFRALMHEAMKLVAQDEVPYIFNTIESMFKQYHFNTFMHPDLLPVDTLAIDLGLETVSADQYLKQVFKKSTLESDKRVWDLLPIMFAVAFPTSLLWKEAVYKPQLEGYLNNAHNLSRCINDLIITFGTLTNPSGSELDIIALLQRFIEVSSVILLRMARTKDKHSPTDFPSVIIFMDKFMEDAKLLTYDALDSCLPYSLLRNMYKDVYENKNLGKTADATIDTAGY